MDKQTNADMKKAQAADNATDIAKKAGSLALQSYGVPKGLSNLATNKMAKNPMVKKVANQVASNPVAKAALNRTGRHNQSVAPKSSDAKEKSSVDQTSGSQSSEAKSGNQAASGASNFLKNMFGPGGGSKDKFAQQLKIKLILYAGAFFLAIFSLIIVILIMYTYIVAPIESAVGFVKGAAQSTSLWFEKLFNVIQVGERVTDEEGFYVVLENKNLEYAEKGVALDVPLLAAISFYEENLEESVGAACADPESELCGEVVTDYNQLIYDVKELADNSVHKDGERYYCTAYEEISPGNYGEVKNYCGTTKESCDCTGGRLSSTKGIALKSEEEYRTWLKENFVEGKLKRAGYVIPTDEAAKNDLFDYVIDEFYERRDLYLAFAEENDFQDTEGSYGEVHYSKSYADGLPSGVVSQLADPLGEQNCRQTSCFGVYNSDKSSRFYCKSHKGVDIGKDHSVAETKLYAIADGVVTGMTNYSKNCSPHDSSNRSVASCSGRIITIKHQVIANGQTHTIISKYVHLASFADPSWPNKLGSGQTINIKKGQFIGIMGNTGFSTAIHLHFELLSGDNKLYNPEELFAAKKCDLISTCSAARTACGKS